MSQSQAIKSMHFVSTYYFFKNLESPDKVKTDLIDKAAELNIRGLIIIGHEGFNATTSAFSKEGQTKWKAFIEEYFGCQNLFFKDSESEIAPFRRFVVKIRAEIVTAGIPEMTPKPGKNHHLTPAEWDHFLKTEKDFSIIDTRNWYEFQIGTFKGAINPNIEKFTEFPDFMEKQGISKQKKILIFCTGGIRCEKGILELQKQGYNNVYQLEGGIINYIKEFPRQEYEGECFVFDHRVALDQNLQPSTQFKLCPHCGQPAKTVVACSRCNTNALICDHCLTKETLKETCSKNCAYHFSLNRSRKGKKQAIGFDKGVLRKSENS